MKQETARYFRQVDHGVRHALGDAQRPLLYRPAPQLSTWRRRQCERRRLDSRPIDTWMVLYFTTPFLVSGAWLWNRRTDPGTSSVTEAVLPRMARHVIGGAALANLINGSLTPFVKATLFGAGRPFQSPPVRMHKVSSR